MPLRRRPRLYWLAGTCRVYDLAMRLLAEKCPEWTEEQRKEFEAQFTA
jgi:hypothetical protein